MSKKNKLPDTMPTVYELWCAVEYFMELAIAYQKMGGDFSNEDHAVDCEAVNDLMLIYRNHIGQAQDKNLYWEANEILQAIEPVLLAFKNKKLAPEQAENELNKICKTDNERLLPSLDEIKEKGVADSAKEVLGIVSYKKVKGEDVRGVHVNTIRKRAKSGLSLNFAFDGGAESKMEFFIQVLEKVFQFPAAKSIEIASQCENEIYNLENRFRVDEE